MVKDEQRTISAGSVILLHILLRQSTEQCNMESSRIDLKNSIVAGSENTKTDGSRLVLVPCMRVLTVPVRVQVQVLSSQVRVQV